MREIKFRGKRKDNGEWVYGELLSDIYGQTRFIVPGKPLHQTWQGMSCIVESFCWEVIPKTVGQYTGLKDKNGREIYKGDIVIERTYPMFNDGLCNYRCCVVWYEDRACFGLEMYTVSNRVRGAAVPDSISDYAELEVIGNIHTTPELLEQP